MTTIRLNSDQDRYTISVGKNAFGKAWLIDLVERLRMEELANQFGFDESVEEIGEQIKADWWTQNKARFIND